MNLRHHLSQIALVIGAVLLSIGVQAFAFTQPSTSPPNRAFPKNRLPGYTAIFSSTSQTFLIF